MSMLLLNANAIKIPLADESVHCVITSPPYWNLRDYGIPDQLGLEDTIEGYVENMVIVFREVWRVLHRTGQLFLNISDTRTKDRQWCGIPHRLVFALQEDGWRYEDEIVWSKTNPMPGSQTNRFTRAHEFMFMLNKSKRAFFDLDAVREAASYEGKIIQCGPNSRADVDRVPRKHLKQDAIGKRTYTGFNERWSSKPVSGRNKRTVWEIPTYAWKGAHFATFPPALVEPCIKAGSSEHGVCPKCGAGWERVTEKTRENKSYWAQQGKTVEDVRDEGKYGGKNQDGSDFYDRKRKDYDIRLGPTVSVTTLGWQPTCKCKRVCPSCAGGSVDWTINSPCCQNKGSVPFDPVPAIVLDPFCGSGTTLLVARKLGRRAIGLDLSFDYLHDQAKTRLGLTALEEWETGKNGKGAIDDLPLFAETKQETK